MPFILGQSSNPSTKTASTDEPVWRSFTKGANSSEFQNFKKNHFDKYQKEVLFPFGYGLSYTDFKYSNLRISRTEKTKGIQVKSRRW